MFRSSKRSADPEDPQPLEVGDLPPPLDMSNRPREELLYSTDETPVTYRQRSVIKPNPMSPWTRLKPLLPNILDRAAVMAVHKNAAIRKKSGHKWVPVQEK